MDKVTGRARFGADFNLPGQLIGRVLRSPHPHARIISIDTSKAEALPGVKAVITREDFADQPSEFIPAGEMMMNYKDVVRNVMAREKALYEGHAVAAVAATTTAIARRAVKLIEVKYEMLPHVIDVVEAMKPDAPLLHDDLFTVGVEPKPDKPSNIAKRVEIKVGDVEAGFKKADVIVERLFKTAPVHQGYIEPHAALATVSEDGSTELWTTTQGHYIVRAHCARLLGLDIGKVRVTATEIGGGFGGKTVVYLEPLAIALSRKAKRPVKMVMSREEVFKASGPTSGATVHVKMGATKDGKFVAGYAELKYQAGAFQGSPVQPGTMCAYAPYDIADVHVIGYDVVSNRPKVAAYRAPGAPISEYAVESVVDEIAKKLRLDPIELRMMNAAREGTKAAYGPKFGPIGLEETLNAIKKTEHWNTPLRKWQGRGVASGFWFNIGGETTVSLTVNEDGTISLMAGTPDIGGLRASLVLGGRGRAGRALRQGAADHRRHRLARLQLPHRRQPLGLLGLDGHRGGGQADQGRSRRAGLQAVGGQAGPGRVQGRRGAAARRARREGQADDHRGLRQDRRARPAGPSAASAASTPRARARASARTWWTSRWIRRPGARRSCATRSPRTRAGRCIRPTSRGSTRAGRCRASAGRSTRSTSTARTASCRTRASSTTACRWPRTCR